MNRAASQGSDGFTSLTRERVTKVAGPKRQIILTFVNRVRLDFARTWAAHVRRLGLTNWLVGATDEGALQGLIASKTPCFSMRMQPLMPQSLVSFEDWRETAALGGTGSERY